MIRSITLITLLSVITGCASSGRIGAIPSVADKESSSQLVLIRVGNIYASAVSYIIALDGNDVFSIRSGEYTEFPISTGEHSVSVKCFGGLTPTWKEDVKQFNALANQTNYFKISPNLRCAEIVPIDPTIAKKKMKSSDFVSPDKS